MALEGTLKDFALPDIFQLIALQKKTGVLVLRNDDDDVTIAFKDGMLVSADSKGKRLEERLGTRLVRSGLITEGQLHDVLEKQRQTLQRLGIVLVNDGLVKKEDLRRALEIQVSQIIYRVFRWEDAYYRFDQDAQIDYDRENFVPIAAESILMEGMRIIDEWPIVEKAVPSMQAVFEKVPVNQPIEIEGAKQESDDDDDFDFDLGGGSKAKGDKSEDKITLSADEGAVYQLLDGHRAVDDVMYQARLSEFDTAKAVFDLLNRDLIREKSSSKSASSSATKLVAQAAEASPVVVWVLLALVAGLTVAGVVFHPKNPVNGDGPGGANAADVQRLDHAALASRLDATVNALEAYRLASVEQLYPKELQDLVDVGYLEPSDIQNPWGEPFEYTVVESRQGYRLQALDTDDQPASDLRRDVGEQPQH